MEMKAKKFGRSCKAWKIHQPKLTSVNLNLTCLRPCLYHDDSQSVFGNGHTTEHMSASFQTRDPISFSAVIHSANSTMEAAQ